MEVTKILKFISISDLEDNRVLILFQDENDQPYDTYLANSQKEIIHSLPLHFKMFYHITYDNTTTSLLSLKPDHREYHITFHNFFNGTDDIPF